MEHLSTKFSEVYNNSKELDIHFIDEAPLTIKRVRYNQSGIACYCFINQEKGKEKTNNQWIEKDCTEDCEHRIATNSKKPACLIEATLKFMIPTVSNDRIWYLKTTSYYSIQNISSYITLQNKLGNSLIGNYKLFLKPKENIIDGKTFNNFVLDLVKEENFISKPISNQEHTNIDNQKSSETPVQKEKKTKKTSTTKETSKGTVKSIPIPKSSVEKPTEDDLKRYYILMSSEKIELKNKDGIPTKYLQATFCDKDNNEVTAIMNPKYAEDMSNCELGSQFLLDIETFGNRQIINNCEYLIKQMKKAV